MRKIIFFGTPLIAKKVLEELYYSREYDIVAVVCQPDRKSSRNKIVFSHVKQFALEKEIRLFQPNKTIDIIGKLVFLEPELFLVCAYGEIIPEDVLKIPEFGCVNLHASLLPKYRGASPINAVIANGEEETGITVMRMVKKMDAGDIIYQERIKISSDETYSSLYDKLCTLAGSVAYSVTGSLFCKTLIETPQKESEATYCYKITRENEKINWNEPNFKIEPFVRSLADKPYAYTDYDSLPIKICSGKCVPNFDNAKPGTILKIDKEGILVKTLQDAYLITKLQLPSKNVMLVKELINGNHPFKINTQFN